MQRKVRTSLSIIVAAVLAVSACSPVLPAPAATESPSSTPDLAMTGVVQTLTAIPPSFTPTTEKTPTVTATPFPTITPISTFTPIPSFTPISISIGGSTTPESTQTDEYACKLTAKSPADWTVFTGRKDFDGSWKIKNTGTQMWRAGGAVAVLFIDGTKLQKNKGLTFFNLIEDVDPGETLTLAMKMLTPKGEGGYTSTWGLQLNKDKSIFCQFSMKIKVEK